ncbi:MAG: competence protein CoiA [Planctomycetes bacterium]|nr:competence protein CoiA [Planctomycetota bacterium]
MSSRAFKIPYGERHGELLHISAVERGLRCNCVCPVCREPLVARKGPKVQHHFGHLPGANCSAETVLHQLGKRLLHRRMSAAITAGDELPFEWLCQHCGDRHEGNLVTLADRAAMELDLGVCRPDVTLLKTDGTPVAFVEIVVSHAPDENVLAHAAAHNVTLVEFHLNAADDLEALEQSPTLSATKVDVCTRPKCTTCGCPLCHKMVHVVDGECWRCNAPMKIAMLMVEGTPEGPERFSERDCAVAREQGAILQENYSRTLQKSYLSNTCGICGAFIGTNFLHEYWPLVDETNGHATGDMCLACLESE